jgi:hypothetical protein
MMGLTARAPMQQSRISTLVRARLYRMYWRSAAHRNAEVPTDDDLVSGNARCRSKPSSSTPCPAK